MSDDTLPLFPNAPFAAGGAVPDEPGPRLRQRLEHQDAGHHREAGEMVRQIFLSQGQVLDRDQGLTRLQVDDAVDHGLNRKSGRLARPPRLSDKR